VRTRRILICAECIGGALSRQIVDAKSNNFTGIWRGYLSGTNRGPMFVRVRSKGDSLKAVALFFDFDYGPNILHLSGKSDGVLAAMRLLVFTGTAPVCPLDGHLSLRFDEATKTAEGIWATDIGTAGICKLNGVKESWLSWHSRRTGIEIEWFVKRWRATIYTVLLCAIVAAALRGQVQLSALILIPLLLPAPFLFSKSLTNLVAVLRGARIRKIGPVEFEQNPATADVAAFTAPNVQQDVAFGQLNKFLAVKSKVLLKLIVEGNGLLLEDFKKSAQSLGVLPANVETTLDALAKTGCVQNVQGKVLPTDWGRRFANNGLRFV
jgi:hypothetical protein